MAVATVRKQSGPKPTGWLTVEINDALLIGEQIAGKWHFDCDEFPEILRMCNQAENPLNAIKAFLRRSSRGKS
jgi:hypothetical protein